MPSTQVLSQRKVVIVETEQQLSLVTYNVMNNDGTKILGHRMRWMDAQGQWVSDEYTEFADAQKFLVNYHNAKRLPT